MQGREQASRSTVLVFMQGSAMATWTAIYLSNGGWETT